MSKLKLEHYVFGLVLLIAWVNALYLISTGA